MHIEEEVGIVSDNSVRELPPGASFKHTAQFRRKDAAARLCSVIFNLFEPSSVLDLGCGSGNFLSCFKDMGVHRVLGCDGSWVPQHLLDGNLDKTEFLPVDLERIDELNCLGKFDLAISLEVGEHLSPAGGDSLISALVSSSDHIVFSAAIPGQLGDGHINCQWPDYWAERFRNQGFNTYDILRMQIWDDPEIAWWYRQNIFVAIRQGADSGRIENSPGQIASIVHCQCFEERLRHLDAILSGQYPIRGYMSMLRKKVGRLFRRGGNGDK